MISEREAQTLEFIQQGYTLKQIAIKLNVAKGTVQTYKRRAIKKMNYAYAV